MKVGFGHWTLICFLIFSGCCQQKCSRSNARKIQPELFIRSSNRHVDMNEELRVEDVDPSKLHVFFTPDDLKAGKTISIFFPIKNQSQNPKLLPKSIADSIPFSSSNLSYLLGFFSISTGSPQATAMEYTLTQCEIEPMRGETKFCATSLESLLDSTRGVLGLETQMKAMTTRYPRNFKTQLQSYTILKEPRKLWSPRILSCHTMPYPYMVFYCHSQTGDQVLYEVSLGAENGDQRVEGIAICHMDTSEWDRENVVFRVMKVEPGASAICHFYPADNIAWISLPADSDSLG